ncbi:hypothetical protein Dda_8712 [Drechslerella dactyloides]|uniref:Uncharacterized protein n=1 Tax=Drechslerella dactyloides TaxID=74499 RepID=A0AAD6IR39_DREDA|nr:hypothetical protein Dda_8712 [Drechslerella dactyloides]
MGQASSSELVPYRPKRCPWLPDRVKFVGGYSSSFDPEPILSVNFEDEDSLRNELIECDIAGIMIQYFDTGEDMLYLFDEDREELKTSILRRSQCSCRAVYSEKYRGQATYLVENFPSAARPPKEHAPSTLAELRPARAQEETGRISKGIKED